MLLIVAVIVVALASPKVTGPIRDALRGQTDAVATERTDPADKADGGGEEAGAKRKARATPTPTATDRDDSDPLELSRRLNAVTERLRTSDLPQRSRERAKLERERDRLQTAYAQARRDEDRRRRTERD